MGIFNGKPSKRGMAQPFELKALVGDGKLGSMTQVPQEYSKQAILDTGKLQRYKSAHEQAKRSHRKPFQELAYTFFD